MTRVLVYGFGLYPGYSRNISQLVTRALSRRKGVSTHVFEVEFNANAIRRVLDRRRPDVVIGLGQHPRARKLRIERRALNAVRRTRGARSRPIEKGRARARFATLRLPKSKDATVTYRAGTYACNYSMWVVSEWCEEYAAKWAFVHIPKDMEIQRAVRYLERALFSALAARTHL